MRSEAVLNLTGVRAMKLMQGAVLWRKVLDARGDEPERKAQDAWRKWLDRFEPRLGRQNAVYHAVQSIVATAYTQSLHLAATDPDT